MPRITPADLRSQDAGEAPGIIEALAPLTTGLNKDGSAFTLPVELGGVSPSPAVVTGTLSAVNNGVVLDTLLAAAFLFDIAPSASLSAGAVAFEATFDAGTTWRPITATRLDATGSPSTTLSWTGTGAAYSVFGVAPTGASQVRVRVTTAPVGGTLGVRGFTGAQFAPLSVGVTGSVGLTSGASRVGFFANHGVWFQETISATLAAGATSNGASRDALVVASGSALTSSSAYGEEYRAAASADQAFTLRIDGSDDGTNWDTFVEVASTSKGITGNQRHTANAAMSVSTRYVRSSVTNTSATAFTVARHRSVMVAA